jgi:hypothetical protein
VPDIDSKYRPDLESQLESGEELRGMCIATQQSTFKGRAVALGVTDRRLLLQPLDRRGDPKGDPESLPPERIASAEVDGAGGGWANVGPAILDSTAVTLKLRTADGQKLKLMMMRGTGALGRLGGGEAQRDGLAALGRWFEEIGEGRGQASRDR